MKFLRKIFGKKNVETSEVGKVNKVTIQPEKEGMIKEMTDVELTLKLGELAMYMECDGIEKVLKEKKETIPLLIQGLGSRDERTRDWAAHTLKEIGINAVASLESLDHMARNDPNPQARSSALHAIEKICTEYYARI